MYGAQKQLNILVTNRNKNVCHQNQIVFFIVFPKVSLRGEKILITF